MVAVDDIIVQNKILDKIPDLFAKGFEQIFKPVKCFGFARSRSYLLIRQDTFSVIEGKFQVLGQI